MSGPAPADRQLVEVPSVLDIRLLPVALSCWAAALVAIGFGWRIGLILAGVLTAAAIALSPMLFRDRKQPGAVLLLVLLAVLLTGAGFAAAAAWQEYRAETHPLRHMAGGTYVTAVVVPSEDPKQLPEQAFGPRQWMVRAGLLEYRHGPVPVRAGGSVIVLAPGPGWSALVPGQQVTFRARVQRPWRHDLTVAVLRAQGPPTAVGPPPWWQVPATAVRTRFVAAAQRALPERAAGLLPGLVDGDTARLPDDVRENFTKTDLSHLVAVSGTNVTIVLASVLVSVRRVSLGPRVGALLAALALTGFVILARPSPTVLRAAVMGAVTLTAVVTGRRRQALPALCTAVVGLLAFSPGLALDAGFALSVLATAGLILLAPGWSQWLVAHGWPHRPAEAVSVALAAFLLSSPVIAALTGHVGLLAVLANVLVEPVVAPITVLGTLGALLSCLWLPGAVLLLRLTGPPLWWLLEVSGRGAALGISLSVPSGVWGGAATAAVVAVLVALSARPPGDHRTPADPDG
ncbi:ComEC/Rec2 family competence protein [Nocardia stercoris]|uniref:ComEC/Rec2 family competence protein n=1 Tax=Nocardia stercoris TaxID=2483361 RepID=A0A3M2L873_9NOCA|nr:ComEC/Rec2 family competence protein [Nocardia stercoris]RMI32870.1 ComEC/Rec2 family competence protein [Nocardia stercoris]